jgi:hypothetical protein
MEYQVVQDHIRFTAAARHEPERRQWLSRQLDRKGFVHPQTGAAQLKEGERESKACDSRRKRNV